MHTSLHDPAADDESDCAHASHLSLRGNHAFTVHNWLYLFTGADACRKLSSRQHYLKHRGDFHCTFLCTLFCLRELALDILRHDWLLFSGTLARVTLVPSRVAQVIVRLGKTESDSISFQ